MTDEPGKDLAPRVPPQPPQAPIDPEQLRQFEEFQRFQEFQRYQREHGGAPPPPPPQQPQQQPYKGKPLWLILLNSKLVRRLVTLVIVALLAMWGYNHYFGGDDQGNEAVDSGGMTGGNQVLRPSAPFGLQGTVGQLYKHVAHGDANKACLLFTDEAQKQFAQAWGASDCQTAVRQLKAEVTDVSAYERSGDSPPVMPTTDATKLNSCQTLLNVNGGPRLGDLDLQKQGAGWAIVSYTKSSCG